MRRDAAFFELFRRRSGLATTRGIVIDMSALSVREAETALEGAEIVPVHQAGIAEAKELQSACLAAGVPVLLGRDDHCTKGCSPKLLLLARAEDVARVAKVYRDRFHGMVLNDGSADPMQMGIGVEHAGEDEPPCPACGSSDPLVEGACAGCGLQLG
jgi:hypothetical protein